MEIERENRLLLEKMSMIMESGRPEMASANTTEFAPGTRLDRHQYPMVDHYKKLEHRSLNKEARRRELLRITADNQAILARIQVRQFFCFVLFCFVLSACVAKRHDRLKCRNDNRFITTWSGSEKEFKMRNTCAIFRRCE